MSISHNIDGINLNDNAGADTGFSERGGGGPANC